MRLPGIVRRHPRVTLGILGLGFALFVFGIIWFEPQKLFLEDRVNEAPPGAAQAAGDGEQAEIPAGGEKKGKKKADAEPAGPQTIANGQFISLEHESHGRALVVETPDGSRFLRFEDFNTSNGPDLVVYLSSKPATDDWYGYDADFVDLGELKGNIGNQNYEIPEGTNLNRYSSAVVWCRRFTVGFAVAPLA